MKIKGRKLRLPWVKEEEEKNEPLFPEITPSNFGEFIASEAKSKGVSEAQIVEEMFHDGWLTFIVEESGGTAKIDASQLFKKDDAKKDDVEECIRLRNTFGPISACVDHIKNTILGGGVSVLIDRGEDALQKEAKEYLESLIEDVYQDEYTRGLNIILPILVDTALTTGMSAAEITYAVQKTFWDYAKISQENKYINIDGKNVEVLQIDIASPNWKDLEEIRRLKIMNDAHKRFKLYRDPESWEAKYWSVDETGKKDEYIELPSGIRVRKNLGPEKTDGKPKGEYFHTWQIFWLVLNRKDFSERGTSVILPVLGLAKLFEKILKAVGEGIYRAGNKKYFIVCGTEKRPWSGPHVRNVLQQLKEASEKNWSTIPMPMGFDIKDIGGEVFEAEEVVAYFKKLVARGMNVPSSVLGVFVRDEPEQNYRLLQINLEMAVKHQLFKRGMWCKYGDKKQKQGGKSEKATYIPNVRFKVEDLMTPKQKLQMFVDSLNVANPLHPLVKLKTESEYCKLMGWDDVVLPTQEEMKKEIEEAKKAAEEKLKKGKPVTPADLKSQGPPKPMTEEQQKKRLEGMAKKGETEKGKAKPLGETRVPKEVAESVAEPIPTSVVEIKVTGDETIQKSEHDINVHLDVTTRTPLDTQMRTLAEQEADLVNKKLEKVELEKKLIQEESDKRKEKIQKEIEKLEAELTQKREEIEKTKREIEKVKTETEEMKKTHEKKRKVIEEASKTIRKEKEFMEGEK